METHIHNIDLEAAADRRLRAGKGNVRVKRKVEKGGPDGEDTWVTETIKLGTDVQHHINRQIKRQWKSGLNQAEQLSPLNVLNEQTKVQIKNKLKANAKPLTELGFSAAVYCALFHEAKRGLKTGVRHIAKSRRRVTAVTDYMCDVVLPTALFGPIFGVLLRLTLPF